MTIVNESLREIVSAVREGTEFYEFAARRVEPPCLKTVFGTMARAKSDFVRTLQAELHDRPIRSNGAIRLSDIARGIHASGVYASARTAFRQNPPAQCLEPLIEQEERILEALYHVLDEAPFDECHPRIADILRSHLPRMHSCHDAMRRARIRLTISN